MSHFSPLLLLCAVSAAALNSFTALDPTGAYEQYLDALGENTPAIAAFFDAAESGVFPWTIPGVSEPIPSPVPDLLPQPPEVVDPVIPNEPEEPVSQFTTVDASYFDDALFLGDSHTDGFHDYAGLGNATYFTKNGLTVKDAVEKSFIELDGKNELKSGSYNAGLEKDGHEPEGTLTIKDDKGKDGSLTAEGGDGGGTIVCTGTPEEVAQNPHSFTGQYLRPVLERAAELQSQK